MSSLAWRERSNPQFASNNPSPTQTEREGEGEEGFFQSCMRGINPLTLVPKIFLVLLCLFVIFVIIPSIFLSFTAPKITLSKIVDSKFQNVNNGKSVQMSLEVEMAIENFQNSPLEFKMAAELWLDYSMWESGKYYPMVKIDNQTVQPKSKQYFKIKWEEKIDKDSYAMQQCRVLGETKGEIIINGKKANGYFIQTDKVDITIKCKIE